jgi:hypothetical protein
MSIVRPDVQTLTATDLWRNLGSVLDRAARNEVSVVVEQGGETLAAIIQPDELERLRRLEAEWVKPFAVIDRMRAAFADLSEEEIERNVADVIARTRAEACQSDATGNQA